jgi:PKD repeat protein
MKTKIKLAIPVLLGCSIALVNCKKNDPELTGTPSVAAFDYVQASGGDTLPYAYNVRFTNKSSGEFLYQWDFGDGSVLSSEKNPVHTYKSGGVYDVGLTTVGTNGNSFATKKVNVVSACSVDVFSKLTGCGSKEWTWSLDGDAIKVLAPDGVTVYYSGGAGGCQADDVYTFGSDGKFTYNANGQTFDVQAGYSCQAPKANASQFRLVVKASQLPQVLLGATATGTGRPFIGTTDYVVGDKYDVVSYDDNNLVLRGVIENTGGQFLQVKFRKVAPLGVNDALTLLTGGSSKTWKLDPADGSIIVGTEGNPSAYFGGGPIEDCQKDDRYTFTIAGAIVYNAAGATYNGGNIAPNYTCGTDRSYTTTYNNFAAPVNGLTGIAGFTLPGTPPTRFIGVTDVPAENYYRIIDITASRMVLRAGNGSGTIFQLKLIPQ